MSAGRRDGEGVMKDENDESRAKKGQKEGASADMGQFGRLCGCARQNALSRLRAANQQATIRGTTRQCSVSLSPSASCGGMRKPWSWCNVRIEGYETKYCAGLSYVGAGLVVKPVGRPNVAWMTCGFCLLLEHDTASHKRRQVYTLRGLNAGTMDTCGLLRTSFLSGAKSPSSHPS